MMASKPREHARMEGLLASAAATTSCTECQRRKQKCSREWPCNHCRSRKVPQLCQFGSKGSPSSSTGNASGNKAMKRRKSSDDDSDTQTPPEEVLIPNVEGIEAWGYMSGSKTFNLQGIANGESIKIAPTKSPVSPHLAAAIREIPPRSLTDAIVQNFLAVFNYQYYALYPPTFLNAYVEFWDSRSKHLDLSPAFTCLLMRVLACSTQYLTPDLRETMQMEMAESIQMMSERFHRASEQLSKTIGPGEGGLMQVQQLFLAASWWKYEGQCVEAWHLIGAAVREGQELSMHKKEPLEDITEFDLELRRRVWCILYVWDYQMSTWLMRPLHVDHRTCTFQLPNLRLEESTSEPGLPSPFTHMALQAKVIMEFSRRFGGETSLSPKQIFEIEEMVDRWATTFPAIYRVDNPDTSYDESHPYFKMQRRFLVMIFWMFKVTPLKTYLTQDQSSNLSSDEIQLRAMGVDCAINLMHVSKLYFDVIHPLNPKCHFSVFTVFDGACISCSAIIHDTHGTLPRRQELREQIDVMHDIVRQVSTKSKHGAMSLKILDSLIVAIDAATPSSNASSSNNRSYKKIKTETSVSPPDSHHGSSSTSGGRSGTSSDYNSSLGGGGGGGGSFLVKTDSSDGVGSGSGNGGWVSSNAVSETPATYVSPVAYDPYATAMHPHHPATMQQQQQQQQMYLQAAAAPSFEDFDRVDFRELGEVWDWDSLNLGFGSGVVGTEVPPPVAVGDGQEEVHGQIPQAGAMY